MLKYILAFFVLCFLSFYVVQKYFVNRQIVTVTDTIQKTNTPSPTTLIELETSPQSKVLQTNYHIFQTFDNCGPAALSMALRFYGIAVDQQELGQDLRPWQNPQGIDDDKSVTLDELGEKAKEYNLTPYHRPNGSIEMIKKFISYDIPVITRTWTKANEDIGHYRIVKGYNDEIGQLIQDDSLQNKNLWYSYTDFLSIWQKFNFEYLILVPGDKLEIAKAILSDEKDEKIAWQNAVRQAQDKLSENPDDIYTRFNLSVAYYEIGDYQKSVEEYEKVQNQLPFRTLWYQIEPIKAYYELGNYERVFQITDKILNNGNLAFSELYYLRGQIYLKQDNKKAARQQFEKAILYKHNYQEAKDALNSILLLN